jgi:hypothetical protein
MNTMAIASRLGFSMEQTTLIPSPFARALAVGDDLNALFTEKPEQGEAKLVTFVSQVQAEIEGVTPGGLIIYRLVGAEPLFASPMQYGGHYLERDRQLLDLAKASCKVALVIEGGPETYLDFVSDLPAHVFMWDEVSTGTSREVMKQMRLGELLPLNDLNKAGVGIGS